MDGPGKVRFELFTGEHKLDGEESGRTPSTHVRLASGALRDRGELRALDVSSDQE